MTKVKRTVAVTGATGFVGRHVVERLLAENVNIRCIVRSSSDTQALKALSENITFVTGDITDLDSLVAGLTGADAVINVAGYREFWAKRKKTFYRLNQEGAENVFQAALFCKLSKVVHVSTPLAFGIPASIPFDESAEAGKHPSDYAHSKYLGDCAGWQLHKAQGLPLTVVHLAAVIGAGDDKATMEVGRALEKKMPALIGADTEYTYVYVRDAAEAIVRALLHPDSIGRRYLIGAERATTREYFKKIGRIADVPVPKINIPEAALMPMAKGMERLSRITGVRPILPLDVLKTTAAGSLLFDCSRSIEELGMSYTSLDQALSEAIDEYRNDS